MKIAVFLFFGLILLSGCTQSNNACGIENCHGLDIICGPNIPQACTELYQLGDFCREYVNCSVINGACALETNQQFVACKGCIENCENAYDGIEAFDCESVCREEMEK